MGDERLTKLPDDLDLKPYRDEHDYDLMRRMAAAAADPSHPAHRTTSRCAAASHKALATRAAQAEAAKGRREIDRDEPVASGGGEPRLNCSAIRECRRRAVCSSRIDVQGEDHDRPDHGRDVGQPAVDEGAHDVLAAGEHQQRDDRRRQGEAQHHLADDQRVGRIDAEPDDDESGRSSSPDGERRSECGSRRSPA